MTLFSIFLFFNVCIISQNEVCYYVNMNFLIISANLIGKFYLNELFAQVKNIYDLLFNALIFFNL